MKKIDNKYIYWGVTAFCVLAAFVLLFFLIYRWDYFVNSIKTLITIFTPFIYGLVIAYILNPIVLFFDNKVYSKLFSKAKNRRKIIRILSLTSASIVFLGCLVALFSLLIPNIIKSIEMLANNITFYLRDSKSFILSLFQGERFRAIVNNIYSSTSSTIENWFSANNLEGLFLVVKNGFFETLKVIYNLIIGFIISLYILNDKEKFKAQSKKLLYALFKEDTVNMILENTKTTDKIFADFFSAKFIDSLIVGIICFVGMLIFKMPYALMISVIVGVTNIIPYFGPFIGAVPAALIILLVDPTKCIWFLLFIIVLQQFDGSVLGPKILGSKTGLSSFWVLFSLLVFGKMFGVVGMIIGVPIFSIFYTWVNNQLKRRLANKNLPVDSSDYETVKKIRKKNGKLEISN
jgi:predicted PurR-regulated permease PerM